MHRTRRKPQDPLAQILRSDRNRTNLQGLQGLQGIQGTGTGLKRTNSDLDDSQKKWSFNSASRTNDLLQSSSSLGVKPLTPPRKRKSDCLTQEDTHFPQLVFTAETEMSRSVQNLSVYFPYVDSVPKSYHRFRRTKKQPTGGPDYFSSLPDEMVLRVFKFLPKSSLGRVSRVSHRFQHLIEDGYTLWEKIDCMNHKLTHGQLGIVLNRKPDFLRLARATITDTLYFPTESGVKYLDLTMAVVSQPHLATILRICTRLQKLSLEHLTVDKQVLEAMFGVTRSLTTLNLAMCYDLDPITLANFLTDTRLVELNLSCQKCEWTGEDLMNVLNSIPNSVVQLNVGGFRYIMRDDHVDTLCTRLPTLVDLDLSDSQEITGVSLNFILGLNNLQHLGLSRCYSVDAHCYGLLACMKSLRYLELFSLFKESSIKSLAKTMTGIEINKFPFSAIARPTVGTRRSSIWNRRVRD